MIVGRHRKEFQEAIREFNQTSGVVGQRKVFLFGPAPLSIKDVQKAFRGSEESLGCHSKYAPSNHDAGSSPPVPRSMPCVSILNSINSTAAKRIRESG